MRENIRAGIGPKGIILVLALFVLSACAEVSPPIERNFVTSDDKLRVDMWVAILPFDNLTNHSKAGLIVSQLMSSELYSQGYFRLLEEAKVRQAIEFASKVKTGTKPDLDVKGVTKFVNVDAVLTGSVSEYGYKHSLKEEPAVGLNVRLINAKDGAVLWAASHSEVGDGKGRESLNQMAQRIIQRMISALGVRFKR